MSQRNRDRTGRSKALVSVLRRAKDAGVVIDNIDNRLDADVLKQEGISIPFVGPDSIPCKVPEDSFLDP